MALRSELSREDSPVYVVSSIVQGSLDSILTAGPPGRHPGRGGSRALPPTPARKPASSRRWPWDCPLRGFEGRARRPPRSVRRRQDAGGPAAAVGPPPAP